MRKTFLTVGLLLAVAGSATAQDGGLKYFFGGGGSFVSGRAADAAPDAKRATTLAANPSLLVELSPGLYVGGQLFFSDNGDVSDVTVDPSVLFVMGDASAVRPYLQGGLMDVSGTLSYQGAAGVLSPLWGVYIDTQIAYRRLQGVETDGDQIVLSVGFRLHN